MALLFRGDEPGPIDGEVPWLSRAVAVYAESERSGEGSGWNDGLTRQGHDTGRDDLGDLDTLVARVVADLQRAWERERRVGGVRPKRSTGVVPWRPASATAR